mgnify:CR=1 FL=1
MWRLWMGAGAELLLKSPDCSPPVPPGCLDRCWLAEHRGLRWCLLGVYFSSVYTPGCVLLISWECHLKSNSRFISFSLGKLTLLKFSFCYYIIFPILLNSLSIFSCISLNFLKIAIWILYLINWFCFISFFFRGFLFALSINSSSSAFLFCLNLSPWI